MSCDGLWGGNWRLLLDSYGLLDVILVASVCTVALLAHPDSWGYTYAVICPSAS